MSWKRLWKPLQTARTTSALVRQCQKALNGISTWHTVRLYWVPGHTVLGVSRHNLRRQTKRWLDNQHWARCWGLGSTQRQARELISGPSPAVKTRLLSLLGHNPRSWLAFLLDIITRHLHLMGLSDSPLCRRCGAEDETSAHILCECEALASLRHVHLGSFFLGPEDIKSVSLGAIWNFNKGTGLPWTGIRLWGTKGLLRSRCIGTTRARTQS